jgi:hypothetical protein
MFRYTENTRINIKPTQKLAIDCPRRAKILPKLSSHVLTRTAEKMPIGIPMISEMAIDTAASRSDAGKRWRYRSKAGIR